MYQVDNTEAITTDYVAEAIDDFIKHKRQNYVDNIEYAEGRNPAIMNRRLPDDSGPDNRVPVSYARRIINLVVGYMYKPGLIQYGWAEGDADLIMPVFDANEEPIKTAQMGKQSSIHGVGYEYHYVGGDGRTAVPRFVKMAAAEVVPIYDRQIEPELLAFARFTQRDKETLGVMVVDDREVKRYTMKGGVLAYEGDPERHYYDRVPLVVYQNNEEQLGDFDSVEPLINAYDVLVSDSMNEFDRFSWAYLLLKGMSLTSEQAERLKQIRMFENLADTADVSFLTKTIDTAFIQFMSDLVRAEIHRQSGIPNLEDYDGAGASGKTMTKFIYLMELFTDPKEAYFTQGLRDRLDCINRILRKQKRAINVDDTQIIMNRNTPDSSLEQAQIFNAYAGHISKKTLIENFADFVDDPEEEIAQLEAEGMVDVDGYSEEPAADTAPAAAVDETD